jgi:hypothetical protein
METLNRYDITEAGDLSSDDDKASRSNTGRWMEAAEVLTYLELRTELEQTLSEANEKQAEELRVAHAEQHELEQTRDRLREANAELYNENRQLDAKVDELILEVRLQTKRAEDMVCMNANTIAARNRMAIERDQAVTSCRLSNLMRDSQRAELVQQRERVGHLTGRLLDAGVLIASLARRVVPTPENCNRSWEFVRLIRTELEGFTMTGPCDIPLLYAKIDLEMQPSEEVANTESMAQELNREVGLESPPMPAPEPGVITPVVDPRPVAPGFVGRHASDGTLVAVHPEFAKSLDESPGIWQGCVDAAAADAKRLGIDAANPSEDDKRKLMQSVIDAPPAPDLDHDACRDPNCPGHMDIAF